MSLIEFCRHLISTGLSISSLRLCVLISPLLYVFCENRVVVDPTQLLFILYGLFYLFFCLAIEQVDRRLGLLLIKRAAP